MKTCDALKLFDLHQAGLIALLDVARTLAGMEPNAAQLELAKGRWEMLRKLRAYQIFKHNEIFNPAIAGGSPAQKAIAEKLKADCIAADEAFLAYTVKWSARDVMREWDVYQQAMLKMTDDIRTHMSHERQQVVMLLTGSEYIRRPSGQAAPSG